MPALIRYNSKTLRNPNFLTQLKEILSILPSFFAELSNLESSFKTNHSFESSAETLIYSFTLQIIKHFFMFASKKLDHYNESKEILTLFLRCEKLYVENQRNRIYTSKNNEILEKYTPTFIRFLYFIEYFHLNIVLKNKDLIIIESNDNNLLFPVLEIVQFLDILTNIFSSNLKKMSSFLLAFPEEKALLLRIYTFLSFMKTMNYVHNIENSLKLFPNEKVEKKVKDLMLGFEKMAADMRFVIEENNDSSSKIYFINIF